MTRLGCEHLRGTCRATAPRLAGAACVLAAAVFLGTSGCARAPAFPWRASTETIVWPLPPDPPRIRYEGAMTTGQALRFANRTGFPLLDLLVGSPEIKLGTPHGISVDDTTLAIADSGHPSVHLVDLAKRRYRVIGAAGETELRCPVGVATDGHGGVFLADSALARVFHLSGRGKLLAEIEGAFVRPTGVAYDAARRRVHVVDTGSHAVLTFQQEGEHFALLRRLGKRGEGPGGFNFPTHVATDRDGNLVVADSLNHRIQIFDAEGHLLGVFGRAGDGPGDLARPKGVAVDSEGHIYVVDSLYDVVQIYGRAGRCLLAFGGSGQGEGLQWLPTGVCLDGRDRLYVADSGNSRVQVYQYLRQGR